MIAAAYIADQVILATFFVAMTVLYALQLAVEHRAKYDEQQLNEKQRIEDWRVAVTKRGKLPVSPRRGSALNDRDEDSSTSTLQSDQADRDRTVTAGGGPKQKKTLRVGRMQWWFHRLGFLAGLLQSIRYIDPYGVHGIYTYQQLSFINLNAQAIIYTMGMLACFFPLTLVRAVALRERSRTIEIIGITLSICTFIVFNIVVGLYSVFDVKNWLRGVLSLWLAITLFFAVGAFNISSIRLVQALRHLMSVQTVTLAKDIVISPRPESPSPAAEMSPMNATYSAAPDGAEDGTGPAVARQNTESDNGNPQELSVSSSKANLLSDKPSSPSAGARALPPTAEHSSPPSPAQPRSSISANFSSTTIPASAFKGAPRAVVKQYKRMIRKLKQFLIACDLAVLIIATSITVVGIGQVRDAESVYEVTSSYSQAAGQLVVNIAQAVLLLIFFWYAYMPFSTIFSCLDPAASSSDDEEPKSPKQDSAQRSNNRQRPSIQATLNFSAPATQSSTDAV